MISEQKGELVDMGWQEVLKFKQEQPVAHANLNYFMIAEDIQFIIQQSKSSPQFQQNILQPFNQLRDEMKQASDSEKYDSNGAMRKYWDARQKLNKYLIETVAPLNPSLAKVVEKLKTKGHMNEGR